MFDCSSKHQMLDTCLGSNSFFFGCHLFRITDIGSGLVFVLMGLRVFGSGGKAGKWRAWKLITKFGFLLFVIVLPTHHIPPFFLFVRFRCLEVERRWVKWYAVQIWTVDGVLWLILSASSRPVKQIVRAHLDKERMTSLGGEMRRNLEVENLFGGIHSLLEYL